MNRETTKQSILDNYSKVTAYHKAYGKSWYRLAKQYCEELSQKYNVPTYKVVGVLSALSPRNKWERNKIDTETMLKHGLSGTYSTFGNNVKKAYKILHCNNIIEVVKLLNARKTTAFFYNIYNPNSNKVTIDVWALRVASVDKQSLTPKQYDALQDVYIEVANELELKPYELQAMTWGVLREAV